MGHKETWRLGTFHYLDCSEDSMISIYKKTNQSSLFKCFDIPYASIKIKLIKSRKYSSKLKSIDA